MEDNPELNETRDPFTDTGKMFIYDQALTTLCEELGFDKHDLTPDQEEQLRARLNSPPEENNWVA